MVNTKVPRSEWDSELAVGDELELLGERDVDETAHE
jgi:hypothetical protein